MTIVDSVRRWIARARERLENGGVEAADLEELARIARGRTTVRQRLLYLHAATPSVRSAVIGMALHEPVPGSVTQIEPEPSPFPYATVHDAILDGWQVVQFPDQRAPFDDREIDILGYEFILQKLEEYPVEDR
jgi:hypothetical protein